MTATGGLDSESTYKPEARARAFALRAFGDCGRRGERGSKQVRQRPPLSLSQSVGLSVCRSVVLCHELMVFFFFFFEESAAAVAAAAFHIRETDGWPWLLPWPTSRYFVRRKAAAKEGGRGEGDDGERDSSVGRR